MEPFNERLKSLRLKQNLTQEELAEKLFVSRQAVSNWENDKNFPDIRSIVLMSEIFQISLDEFLKGEKTMVKHLENELKEINPTDLIGIIVMLVLSFLLPVAGIALAIIVLVKFRTPVYPQWIKIVAIIALVFQIALICYIVFNFVVFSVPDKTITTIITD